MNRFIAGFVVGFIAGAVFTTRLRQPVPLVRSDPGFTQRLHLAFEKAITDHVPS